MLDEKIAAMRKEERRQSNERKLNLRNRQYTTAELEACVEKGVVLFPFKSFWMERRMICSGQVGLPYPKEFFDQEWQDKQGFLFENRHYRCLFNGVLTRSEKHKETFEEWQHSVLSVMTRYYIYPEVLFEVRAGAEQKSEYVGFLTNEEAETYFNLIYRIKSLSTGIILSGTARCQDRKSGSLGRLMEVIIRKITV